MRYILPSSDPGVRAQVVWLRAYVLVDAARMVGARDSWIMRKHVLPHLVAPIVVWGTLITAGFVCSRRRCRC